LFRHELILESLSRAAAAHVRCARLHYEFGRTAGVGVALLAVPHSPSHLLVLEEARVALLDVTQPVRVMALCSVVRM
jgi:hypothetical protein